VPTLGQDEVHVWIVPVTVGDAEAVEGFETLALAERARASRLRSEVARRCFVQRRASLRAILAGYLGVAPRQVGFAVNEYGKPSLILPRTSGQLSFNAAQSGTVAVIAVARSGRIGIDVERLRPLAGAESIATRFFAAGEAATILGLHPRDRIGEFFRMWTRKEAVVKALGGGLSIPLDAFEISLQPRELPEILRWDIPGAGPVPLRIYDLEIAEGYVGALAVDREPRVCQGFGTPDSA
jgi:4'-phosphopantetheinyl transferase